MSSQVPVLGNEPTPNHSHPIDEKTASSSEDEKATGEKDGSERDIDGHSRWQKSDVETAGSVLSEVLENERDIATHVISTGDDPTLSPWTFRAFFIGIGLSAFGGVLAEIYYFKPQTVQVSTMFLAIISYVLGIFMETFIPRRGVFRYLNPFPFNKKENAFIVIMAGAAANSALGTEVLAVQRLYYNITPNAGASIFLLFSSQLLGYGFGGLMRSILLYPSKMLYPSTLPLVSMFDAFYRDGGASNKKKLRLFYIAFGVIFIWEMFPEWIFPLLTGFSIFCLADQQKSVNFTYVFGGSNGNEGLGLLSICFDWQYIAGSYNPMTIPLQAQFSNVLGYIMCMVIFCAVYYKNIWSSLDFPFLSQELFNADGSTYNQTLILNSAYEVDPSLLAAQGLPFYSGTWVVQLLTSNLGLAATFTHLLLWNRNDLSAAWTWARPNELKRMWREFEWRFWRDEGRREVPDDVDLDPHYREMLKYPDAPNSWYIVVLIASLIMAFVLIYKTDSTLPWWGFIVACLLAVISILFFGSLYAITGLQFIIQPFIQMIAGFIHPRKPMANMYFVLYGYNSVVQAQLLLRDLKIAQYTKLPPRAAFTAQIFGTLFGAVLNFIMMNSIINNQRDILLSVEGTNIWSGQQPQQYNSQAIAWSLSHELFTVGKRYQWVAWAYLLGLFVPVPFWAAHRWWPKLRLDYLYTPIICYYMGWLCVGINSSITSYFAIAWFSQWYLRTRYPKWFVKYNYILGAALDGGTQVMVFLLSFAVQGASGKSHLFPQWWGANQAGNYDWCAVPAADAS
ncbi:OPT oligopeptide transporter [Stereum hirsutum FP-91666 SS1]|uniref:OPT oligopeptide transporter n=1 Tax=Stereum hirsutum (strain FP-91666) TaxID=721885 RepID=UPI0004449C84|nr:OPT oligopeptide transporter [Stereum hirsutum FP-91666 SS1]EIM81122.1 OPT oligopeptide transporter [Stereum hirsutum FP-91666 SS1]